MEIASRCLTRTPFGDRSVASARSLPSIWEENESAANGLLAIRSCQIPLSRGMNLLILATAAAINTAPLTSASIVQPAVAKDPVVAAGRRCSAAVCRSRFATVLPSAPASKAAPASRARRSSICRPAATPAARISTRRHATRWAAWSHVRLGHAFLQQSIEVGDGPLDALFQLDGRTPVEDGLGLGDVGLALTGVVLWQGLVFKF